MLRNLRDVREGEGGDEVGRLPAVEVWWNDCDIFLPGVVGE